MKYSDFYNKIPWFMISSAIAQISLFFSYATGGISWTYPVGGPKSCIMGVATPPPDCTDLRPEVWRLACSQYVHKGIGHLFSNVVLLLVLGIPLEMVHGWFRTGVLYTLGVILGNLSHVVFKATGSLVGCSGGVYSLMGAHAVNIFLNWSEMPNRDIRISVFGSMLVADLVNYWFLFQSGVSYMAHFGGYVSGVLGGSILLRNLVWKKHEIYAVCFLGSVYFSWIVSTLVWYVEYIYPPRSITDAESDPRCLDQ